MKRTTWNNANKKRKLPENDDSVELELLSDTELLLNKHNRSKCYKTEKTIIQMNNEDEIILKSQNQPQIETNTHKHHLNFEKYHEIDIEVRKELQKRHIQMEHIYKLNLPMEENIWFKKYIDIRDKMENHTEDKYN